MHKFPSLVTSQRQEEKPKTWCYSATFWEERKAPNYQSVELLESKPYLNKIFATSNVATEVLSIKHYEKTL